MKITALNNIYSNIFYKKPAFKKFNPIKELKSDCFEYQNKASNLSFEKRMPPIELFNSIGEENFPNETILNAVKDNALNNRDLDLYNIHNAYYSDLLECSTLEEAKELYPEFSDVRDAKTLSRKEMSRKLLEISRGEVENLSLDNLSLELLKKVYGYGYGVNKKEEYFGIGNNSLEIICNTLNIKRISGRYLRQLRRLEPKAVTQHAKSIRQHYIDFPEDRKKISEMKLRQYATYPKIRENISRAVKSRLEDDNIRKKISDSVKKYQQEHPEEVKKRAEKVRLLYEQHPEKRIEQSEKLKKYRKEHPEATVQHIQAMKEYYEQYPEKRIEQSEKLKKFHKEHPEYAEIYSIAGKEIRSEVMSKVAEGDDILKGILRIKSEGRELTQAQEAYLCAYFSKCLEQYPEMNKDTGRRIQELMIERGIKKPQTED